MIQNFIIFQENCLMPTGGSGFIRVGELVMNPTLPFRDDPPAVHIDRFIIVLFIRPVHKIKLGRVRGKTKTKNGCIKRLQIFSRMTGISARRNTPLPIRTSPGHQLLHSGWSASCHPANRVFWLKEYTNSARLRKSGT